MACHQPTAPAGFQSLFSKLHIVSGPRRDDYHGFCPAHSDVNNPSLCVTIRPGESAKLYCYAGCSFQSIVQAAGLTPQDYRGMSDSGEPTYGELEDVYRYRNADGSDRYLKRRYRRQDGSKYFVFGRMLAGVWHKGIEGVDPTVYNLDLLTNYPKADVLIVEGEGKANDCQACRLGLIPTTSGGANSWLFDFGRHFTGRTCYVMPDHDPPGYRYVQQVVGSLVSWGVKQIGLVSMRGFPDGWDVSDVLGSEGVSVVKERIANARIYRMEEA